MPELHKHLVINATVKNPIKDEKICEQWFRTLVDMIDMKVLIEPKATYCNTFGNEGITGTVVIETSHASIHIWSSVEVPYIRMDVYSCKDFEAEKVIAFVDETMGIIDCDHILIDRNDTKLKLING